jgi:hypothetical protein
MTGLCFGNTHSLGCVNRFTHSHSHRGFSPVRKASLQIWEPFQRFLQVALLELPTEEQTVETVLCEHARGHRAEAAV